MHLQFLQIILYLAPRENDAKEKWRREKKAGNKRFSCEYLYDTFSKHLLFKAKKTNIWDLTKALAET